jgi:hypothetical protein
MSILLFDYKWTRLARCLGVQRWGSGSAERENGTTSLPVLVDVLPQRVWKERKANYFPRAKGPPEPGREVLEEPFWGAF